MIARAWLWLRSVLFRARLERDMQEEMSAHVRRTAERLEAAGLSADEARMASRREFGNVAALMEEARDARGGRGIESVCADLRYGVRCLSRTPLSSLTMIVVFSLGIGFNAALFLLISSITRSPVPGVPSDDGHLAFHYLADCALIEHNFTESLRLYRKSLDLALVLGDHVEIGFEVQGVAMSLAGLGESATAVRLVAGMAADWSRVGANVTVRFWRALLDQHMGAARAKLGPHADTAWAEGLALAFDDVIQLARTVGELR